MYKQGLFIFILIIGLKASAHSADKESNHPLLNNTFEKDSNALYFNLYDANFLWNNEFFNPIVNGYTLIGYFLTPEFQYHFSPKIKIQGGVHLLKYSGVESFSTVAPTYSATYTNSDFSLIMGTLNGTVNHRLPEPLLFTERYFTNNLENGVQYLLNKEKFHMDLWLDWQTFIFPMDNKQEELVAGLALFPTPIKNENWEFKLPLSLLAKHRGGQIDTIPDNMQTLMNYGLGIAIQKNFKYRFLDKVSLETHYLGFKDNSPTVESIYEQGGGVLSQISFGHQSNYFRISYWQSHQFLSFIGHPIYQSLSEKGAANNQIDREILSFHLFYSKSIHKNIHLGLMGETYIDLLNNDIDYSMGLTLIIKNLFFIKRFKHSAD